MSVHFKSAAQLPTKEQDIRIDLCCEGYEEEVETWDRLYKIRTRYAAKCLSPSGANYWLMRILDENKNYPETHQDALRKELALCEQFPWHESNFLKGAFFNSCLQGDTFDASFSH